MTAPYALVVADGTKARYGLTACLAALDAVPEEDYPDVHWPRQGDTAALAATIHAIAEVGRLPVVLWQAFSAEFALVADRLAAVRAETGAAALHVIGGPHPSAESAACAAAGFDLVAQGEAELTMRSLHAALLAGTDPGAVPGLGRLVDGVYRPSRGVPLARLDDVPSFPARQGRIAPLEISRGCAYACSFCHTPYVFGARWRHRSVGSVVEQVRAMVARGKKQVRFITPSAMSYGAVRHEANLPAVRALLEAVRGELPAEGKVYLGTFPSEIRPEHATPEALALVVELCENDNIIVGAQSGSDAMLRAAHRGHTVADIRAAVANCAAAGLTANVDMIFGMPGESAADEEASLTLCRELAEQGARIHAHTFLPLPGTPWRDAPPGRLSPRVREEIDRLASAGRAYGSWQRQETLAADLAATGRPGPRRRLPRR